MNRAELERLDRDALVVLAERAGVTRARILTRPELVDELLLRSSADEASKRRARGFFGVARDLLARVVERGLHLPDAAETIRTLGVAPPPKRSAPAALPTVTLAEIYAAQGHRERAVETLESVLGREPDHAAARALLMQLRDSAFPVPPPPLPPEEEETAAGATSSSAAAEAEAPKREAPREPFGMLDDTPLPPRYDVDECVAIPVDPTTLYVYWEARASTMATVRRAAPAGALFLRIIVIVPTWDGPQSRTQDVAIDASLGDWFARDLPPGCVVRAAIGWKHGDTFDAIAHSPSLETPPGSPSPLVADVLVRWTPAGAVRVQPGDPDAAAIERALGRVRREAARARQSGLIGGSALGSSERWATAPWSCGAECPGTPPDLSGTGGRDRKCAKTQGGDLAPALLKALADRSRPRVRAPCEAAGRRVAISARVGGNGPRQNSAGHSRRGRSPALRPPTGDSPMLPLLSGSRDIAGSLGPSSRG